jgi:hypothetical protein
MYFSRSGIVDPTDLKLLRDVLDGVCAGVTVSEQDREFIAMRLIQAFQAGLKTHDQLADAARSSMTGFER